MTLTAREKALVAARVAQEKKGEAVVLLDVEGECAYADVLMVVTAQSDRQGRAIGAAIADALHVKARGALGDAKGGWTLLDFGDVVVHVFLAEVRAYYDIEALWRDAKRIAVPAAEVVEATPPPPGGGLGRARLR
jgi:ribosome-associated protein